MPTPQQIRRGTFLGAAAIVVIGVVVATAPSWSTTFVAVPPRSASARTVAETFWRAAEHRDCATMRALSDPDDTTWCVSWWDTLTGQDPHLLGHGRFSDPTTQPDDGTGETSVRFTVDVRNVSGMPDGRNEWGLFLRHTADGWRVSEEGVV
ncbi:hypothetical protein [Curtobacterium citreum]|uniref:hypothetical protein n=1 Tax=Curtobacterium citreum TaxID=2036 RepID=UPI000737966D|nr:hypothetical protein [Curtobacterium citreum]KTR19337.1 hypothetical protein NS330_08740 [Curtobacterium citreum]